MEQFLADRGRDVPTWPRWCFLPLAGWYAIVSAHIGRNRIGPDRAGDIARLAALGTWRYSLGVYRFDQDVYDALISTGLSDAALPADVLLRLPEWCVYIETPGLVGLDGKTAIGGAWAHAEHDANDGRHELRLLLNLQDFLVPAILHLGPWSVTEAVQRAMDEGARQWRMLGGPGAAPWGEGYNVKPWAEMIQPILSLVLYLCSDEPDISDRSGPVASIQRPVPTHTKRGLRWFAPAAARIWHIGDKIGDVMRVNSEPSGEPGGDQRKSPRTHLRRAHWHGYWSGKLDSTQRRFGYKWLPPIVVGD